MKDMKMAPFRGADHMTTGDVLALADDVEDLLCRKEGEVDSDVEEALARLHGCVETKLGRLHGAAIRYRARVSFLEQRKAALERLADRAQACEDRCRGAALLIMERQGHKACDVPDGRLVVRKGRERVEATESDADERCPDELRLDPPPASRPQPSKAKIKAALAKGQNVYGYAVKRGPSKVVME